MKKLLLTILFTLVLSGGASADEIVLRCDLKTRVDDPGVRTEVEIILKKKIVYVDGDKYNITLVGERSIRAESDNQYVQISIDRFDGFMYFQTDNSKFAGYCKKYNKIF